jgi:hypothetical protein
MLCDSPAHADSDVPKIFRKGETIEISDQRSPVVDGARTSSQAASLEAQPLLVGMGIDVSGSMEANIDNRVGTSQTRLEGFREALSRGISNSRSFLESVQKTDAHVDLFAYAFGLRTGDVCDLLSLVKVADGLISKKEIEDLKERYTLDIKRRYVTLPKNRTIEK